MNQPLCTAPFHSILIETDKTVRPCCSWTGESIGDLNTDNINDILNGEKLQKIQDQMLNGIWPKNCKNCRQREIKTNTSPRLTMYRPSKVPYLGNNKITYIELNSSNLCNLVCVGCNPSWSSAWANFREDVPWWKEFRKDNHWDLFLNNHEGFPDRPGWTFHPSRLDFIGDFFKNIDLSNLNRLMFKGGEPFLNKENTLFLEHLQSLDILKNVDVEMITNGTQVSNKFLNLLSKAKSVFFGISVDGVGKLNQYIRFDPKNPESSHTDNIKQNIKEYAKLDNLYAINPATSVQAHNVFRLEELRRWWVTEIHEINKDKIVHVSEFNHFILGPKELSPDIIQDKMRFHLADFYESLDNLPVYNKVINFLRLPYGGNAFHNLFVKYTDAIDRTRPYKFADLVPEAISELTLIPEN